MVNDIEGSLDSMGKSWFVSRAYSDYIDPKHQNWNNPSISSLDTRESSYQSTRSYHKDLLRLVLKSNPSRLSSNTLNLSGTEVFAMARQLLNLK